MSIGKRRLEKPNQWPRAAGSGVIRTRSPLTTLKWPAQSDRERNTPVAIDATSSGLLSGALKRTMPIGRESLVKRQIAEVLIERE